MGVSHEVLIFCTESGHFSLLTARRDRASWMGARSNLWVPIVFEVGAPSFALWEEKDILQNPLKRLFIPELLNLHLYALYKLYTIELDGHLGRYKMYNLVRRTYF